MYSSDAVPRRTSPSVQTKRIYHKKNYTSASPPASASPYLLITLTKAPPSTTRAHPPLLSTFVLVFPPFQVNDCKQNLTRRLIVLFCLQLAVLSIDQSIVCSGMYNQENVSKIVWYGDQYQPTPKYLFV